MAGSSYLIFLPLGLLVTVVTYELTSVFLLNTVNFLYMQQIKSEKRTVHVWFFTILVKFIYSLLLIYFLSFKLFFCFLLWCKFSF